MLIKNGRSSASLRGFMSVGGGGDEDGDLLGNDDLLLLEFNMTT
jgi:hypothetical protein